MSSQQLKIASFNLRYGTANDGPNSWPHRREMVFELLRLISAEVFAFQEALRFQIRELEEAFPDYSWVGVGRDDGVDKGEFAPIFCRGMAPNRQETFWLSDTPNVPGSNTWAGSNPRICTWARFNRFVFMNVHLDDQSQEARTRAVDLILNRLPQIAEGLPVILAGDFNETNSFPAVAKITGLIDSFRALHGDDRSGTYNDFRYGNTCGDRIDFIFVDPSIRVLDATIEQYSREGRYPSDHFPVTATVELPTVPS